MANGGEMNPFKWNYDAKTLGYMAGGALVGAASGGAAGAVATSGMVGAKTAAIVTGSFVNSVGTHIYTGGQTDVSVSFGFGSFNLTNGTADGIWNWGENSTMENVGYSLGALGNVSDVLTGFNPGSVEVGTKKGWPGHTQAKNGDNVLIDYGPNAPKGGIAPMDGVNDYICNSTKGASKFIPSNKLAGGKYLNVKGLNYKTFSNYASNIKSGKYLIPFNDCVVKVSRALNYSGVFNIGVHPKLLYYQLLLRSQGINAYNYSHYLQLSE